MTYVTVTGVQSCLGGDAPTSLLTFQNPIPLRTFIKFKEWSPPLNLSIWLVSLSSSIYFCFPPMRYLCLIRTSRSQIECQTPECGSFAKRHWSSRKVLTQHKQEKRNAQKQLRQLVCAPSLAPWVRTPSLKGKAPPTVPTSIKCLIPMNNSCMPWERRDIIQISGPNWTNYSWCDAVEKTEHVPTLRQAL